MKIYMRNVKTTIPSGSPVEINLQEAWEELDKFPSIDVFKEGFIGFINGRGEVIQFIRLNSRLWLTDVPKVEGEKFLFSQQVEVPHEVVKRLIERFYLEKDWKSLLIVPKTISLEGRRDSSKILWFLGVIELILVILLALIIRSYVLM